MTKIIFLAFIVLAMSTASIAQCDKAINWISGKEEFLNAENKVEDTKKDSIFIMTNNTDVVFKVNPGTANEDGLKGTVKERSCNWNEPLKMVRPLLKQN